LLDDRWCGWDNGELFPRLTKIEALIETHIELNSEHLDPMNRLSTKQARWRPLAMSTS